MSALTTDAAARIQRASLLPCGIGIEPTTLRLDTALAQEQQAISRVNFGRFAVASEAAIVRPGNRAFRGKLVSRSNRLSRRDRSRAASRHQVRDIESPPLRLRAAQVLGEKRVRDAIAEIVQLLDISSN